MVIEDDFSLHDTGSSDWGDCPTITRCSWSSARAHLSSCRAAVTAGSRPAYERHPHSGARRLRHCESGRAMRQPAPKPRRLQFLGMLTCVSSVRSFKVTAQCCRLQGRELYVPSTFRRHAGKAACRP